MKYLKENLPTLLKQARTKLNSKMLLLFLTGFFFSQFMLLNILYTKNPLGGWVTNLGEVTNSSLLFAVLAIITICLISLWRVTTSEEDVKHRKITKATIIKMKPRYSPIDYPIGSINPVVSNYGIA